MAALTPLLAIGVSGLLRSRESLEQRALCAYLLTGWGGGTLIVISHVSGIAEPSGLNDSNTC